MRLIRFITEGKTIELKEIASSYVKDGAVDFYGLFSVPQPDRLPAMRDKLGAEKVHGLMIVLLSRFQKNFNIDRKMDNAMIVECAYDLMLKGIEYKCSLPDMVVFFERAKSGQYGAIYDRIDTNTILRLFEEFLNKRHEAMFHIKEQKEIAFRSPTRDEDGPDQRMSRGIVTLGGAISEVVNKMRDAGKGLPYHPNTPLDEKDIHYGWFNRKK